MLIQDTPLTIHKQPEGSDSEAYGTKYELEVQVFGGKAPYSYQWMYYTGYRNETDTIENGDYAKDVTKETLVISVEEENVLLGQKIYCVITDAMGTTVKTNPVKIFGPFSMTAEDVTIVEATKEYSIVGTLTDGLLKKGDGISITRNDKIIAIGSVKDIQMFNKSLDEAEKGDRVAIVFTLSDGVRPQSGDVLFIFQDYHDVNISDIVN